MYYGIGGFFMATMNIYVGNLAFGTTETELEALFAQYGEVERVNIIQDRETGRSRGFGFVEMDADAAQAAINELDGTELGGRDLRINQARERSHRPRR